MVLGKTSQLMATRCVAQKRQREGPGSPPATSFAARVLPSLQLLCSVSSWMVVAHVQLFDAWQSGAQSQGQRRAAVSGDQATGQPTHTHPQKPSEAALKQWPACPFSPDLRLSSLQLEFWSPSQSSFTPESCRLLLLRSSMVRLQDGELSADARAVQLFSDRLQTFSLKEAASMC